MTTNMDRRALKPGRQRLATAWILKYVNPTDDPTWEKNFSYIERNHVGTNPEYWANFLFDCKKSIRRPVIIWQNPRTNALVLTNGHHRAWSAVKNNLPNLPVIFKIKTMDITKPQNLGVRLRALGFDKTRYDRSNGTYRIGCGQCEALAINGAPTHEIGCRNAKAKTKN